MGTGGRGSSTGHSVSLMSRDGAYAVVGETDLARVACLQEPGSAVEN
jgi:hypothetical protein